MFEVLKVSMSYPRLHAGLVGQRGLVKISWAGLMKLLHGVQVVRFENRLVTRLSLAWLLSSGFAAH